GGTLVGTRESPFCVQFQSHVRLLRVSNRCNIDWHQEVSGKGGSDHRARSRVGDALALLFPPTTLYQLIRLPARGPKLSIREEEQLVIKLLQPVYAARSQLDQTAVSVEHRRQLAPTFATGSRPASLECPKLSNRGMVGASWRSFQNTTPYYVVVYGNGIPLGRFPPCSESVLLLPRGGLRLKAIATIPDDNGQHEAEAVLGLNDQLTGWQVLSVYEKTSTLR